MKPLIFLTTRTVINSFRRAIHSPTRIVGVVLLVGWWFFIVSGNFIARGPIAGPDSIVFELPPMQVLYAVMFALFLLVFGIRSLSMFSVPGMNRSPDADVLFPTPVSPKVVLMHRFALDYLIALLVPILLLIFSGRRGSESLALLFSNLPEPDAAWLVGRTMIGSFLLVSLFAVSMSYAAGLYLNRDSDASRRSRKVTGWGMLLGLLLLVWAITAAIRSENAWESLIAIPDSSLMRVLLYPVAAASDLAISPLYASWTAAALALFVLLGGSLALIFVALRQADNLYDMSARHSASTHLRTQAARSGDPTLLIVQAAREGKMKPRSVRFLSRLQPSGYWGILWREAVLLLRSNLVMLSTFALIVLALGLMPAIDSDLGRDGAAAIAAMQVLIVTALAIALAFGGFLETLRRVDIQKPLPFTPNAMCAMEVLGKSLGPVLLAVLAALTAFASTRGNLQVGLTLTIALPSVAIAVVAAQFGVILLFPDMDDPTQRTLRGLMQFLGAVLALAPGLIVLLILMFLMPIWLAALFAAATNLAIAALLVGLASPLYASYNPSE